MNTPTDLFTGRWFAAALLTLSCVCFAAPATTYAGTVSPFSIDGTIPDVGCPGSTTPDPATDCVRLSDPFDGSKELGPINSATTKLGSIHTAVPPMLGFTNPNGSTDIVNIWLETRKDDDDDIWLYFAWQRDSNSGSSAISYEFQQSLPNAGCDYSLTDQQESTESTEEETLIANCNPWAGRAADDFLIVWDFGGGATDIILRTFDGTAFDTGIMVTDPSLDFAEALLNGDTSRGEGAINLTDSVFGGVQDTCLTVANIIPGTVAGNSDTADYKDTVFADLNDGIAISNCGTVTVTKATIPGALDGSFPYTLDQLAGAIMYPVDVVPGPCDATSCNDVLTSDGDSDIILDLLPDTDYRLVENLDEASKFFTKSIFCDGLDVTAPDSTFPVTAASTTACTITNELGTGTITVIKEVINIIPDYASPSDFCLSLDDGQTSFAGAGSPGSQFTFVFGTPYAVSEVACGNPDTSPAGYKATFQGDCDDTIEAFVDKTCTVVNEQLEQGKLALTLFKNVVTDNGGAAKSSDWTLAATLKAGSPLTCAETGFSGKDGGDGTGVPGSVSLTDTLASCVYELTETGGPSDYTPMGWSCTGDYSLTNGNELTVGGSGPVTCTITNDDDAPSLTLVKNVTKNNGGTADASDWLLKAEGPTTISGQGGASSDATFDAGVYTLSESGGPSGYTAGDWTCTNGITVDAQDQISIGLGQSTTCSITNDDVAPGLTLVKNLTKNNGGTADATDWLLKAEGPTTISGQGGASSDKTFSVGTYTLSESGGPSGYTAGAWSCTDGITVDAQNQITLTEGQSTTCSITNDDDAPSLTLVKNVTKNNGGTADATDWLLKAEGPTTISGQGGTSSGDTFSAGSYTLSESGGPSGYTAGDWTCTDGITVDAQNQITLTEGQSTTCSITNDDDAPSLTLVKALMTDNAGTALTTNWMLTANGPTTISGAGGATSDGTFSAGTYTLSESGGPSGYMASAWTCTDGIAVNGQSQITLTEGQSTVCTIVNDDIAPSLTLVKVVKKDNGGTANATDWMLAANGPSSISGSGGASSDGTFLVGTYTLSESGGPSGYAASAWTCTNGIAVDAQSQISLTEGQSTVCTIVNDDIQPKLTLVKTVLNDNHPPGTGLGVGDFPLSISGTSGDPIAATSGVAVLLNAGDYSASEVNQAGYEPGDWGGACASDGKVSLVVGDDKTCTITNDDIPPELKIVKTPDVADEVFIKTGGDALFTITVSNIGGGDAYGVTLADALPSPAEAYSNLVWMTTTPGCTIKNKVDLSCDVGFLEKDPTPDQKESGDESSFTVSVIARVPPDFLFTFGQPGGPGTIGSNFEIDGNMVLDGNHPPLIDWSNAEAVATAIDGFFARELDPPAIDLSPEFDTDNSFTEGTKNNDVHPIVEDKSVPPNKSDLTDLLVTQDVVDGNVFVAMAWLRTNSLGTSNFDIELNQGEELSDNGITPLRNAGDILIGFDFSGSEGADGVRLTLRQWDGEAMVWGPARDLNAEGIAFGAVNDPANFGTDPNNEPNPLTGGTLINNTFGEAVVNLTKAFMEDCRVFVKGYVKGRSSDSFSSAMKDFISPLDIDINSCRTIELPNLATAEALNNDQVSDEGMVTVTNDPEAFPPPPAPEEMVGIANVPGYSSDYGVVRYSESHGTFLGGKADAPAGAIGSPVFFQPDAVKDFASISDMSGNGSPELVAMGVRFDGKPRVQIRDSATDTVVNNQLFFTAGFAPLDVAVLPDTGNDGADDVAMLGDNLFTGKITVQIRDGLSGAQVKNIPYLSLAWRAMHLLALENIGGSPAAELGVLATDPDGRTVVMVRDAKSGSHIENVRFLSTIWAPVHAFTMPDYSGNGAQEIGVLSRRKDNGLVIVSIRDAATNAFVRNVFPLSADYRPIKAVALPDENGNGAPELAVLGVHETTGEFLVEIRDSSTGDLIRDMAPLMSNWSAKDMIALDDAGTGSPGLSILGVRKTDGRQVVQTIDTLSGGLVSNVFLN